MVMLHGPPHQVVSYALLAVHHQSLLQGSLCVCVCVCVCESGARAWVCVHSHTWRLASVGIDARHPGRIIVDRGCVDADATSITRPTDVQLAVASPRLPTVLSASLVRYPASAACALHTHVASLYPQEDGDQEGDPPVPYNPRTRSASDSGSGSESGTGSDDDGSGGDNSSGRCGYEWTCVRVGAPWQFARCVCCHVSHAKCLRRNRHRHERRRNRRNVGPARGLTQPRVHADVHDQPCRRQR